MSPIKTMNLKRCIVSFNFILFFLICLTWREEKKTWFQRSDQSMRVASFKRVSPRMEKKSFWFTDNAMRLVAVLHACTSENSNDKKERSYWTSWGV